MGIVIYFINLQEKGKWILYFDWLYVLQLIIFYLRFIWVGYKDTFSIKISKRFLNIRGLRLSSDVSTFEDGQWFKHETFTP